MIRLSVICVFVGLLVMPSLATATTTERFQIRQQIGEDTIPPTIPGNLLATPVSTNQIDVSWDASVDDFEVSGYELYRNGIHIATTTLRTYNDTGLTPSTTYGYTVRAFDIGDNFSGFATTATTTTLSVPEPPPPEESSVQPTYAIPRLRSIDVAPFATTVHLTWRTLTQARYILEWGKTSEYELGTVQNEIARLQHKTTIAGLEPGTQYSYRIIAIDGFGRRHEILSDTFQTIVLPDNEAPPNPADLRAVGAGEQVTLSWRNPSVSDFDRVRIVRSPFFYPLRPDGGYVLFEGDLEQFVDTNAFANNDVQYYTIFAYDENGNRSSGAGIRVLYAPAVNQSTGGEELTSSPVVPTSTSDWGADITLDFSDLVFIQEGFDLPVHQGVVEVSSDAPLTVQLAQTLVRYRLGSMILVLEEQQATRSATYLMQMNRQQTAYEAVTSAIAPGTYNVHVVLYGLDGSVLALLSGELVSASDAPFIVNAPVPDWLRQLQERGVVFLALAVLLLLLFFWRRRRKTQVDKQR